MAVSAAGFGGRGADWVVGEAAAVELGPEVKVQDGPYQAPGTMASGIS